MRFFKYITIFLLGFLVSKFWYEHKEEQKDETEEAAVFLNGIKNMNKLVVSEGSFSEIYSFTDSKKFFYDYLSFDKKAVISVNAKVEVGYDLSQLELQIDSINKVIIINKIPTQDLVISPNIKYFDLEQSKFNSFTQAELNKINDKAIENIKSTITVSGLKKDAKNRLFEELTKIYQLTKIYNWKIVDNTNSKELIPLLD